MTRLDLTFLTSLVSELDYRSRYLVQGCKKKRNSLEKERSKRKPLNYFPPIICTEFSPRDDLKRYLLESPDGNIITIKKMLFILNTSV